MPAPVQPQTIAFQFTAISFDGETLAPRAVLQRDLGDASQSAGDAQFYTAEQEAIGIVPINDPDGAATTSRGNRWLTWLELALTSPAPAGSVIEIIDNSSPASPVVLRSIDNYTGKSLVYLEPGFLIPQGSALRLTGGGGVLRYHITFMKAQELALLGALVAATTPPAPPTPSECCLVFAEVETAAGVHQLELGTIKPYDASALADGAMALRLPTDPAADVEVGIKEVGNSVVAVEVVGSGGANVEGPTTPPAPTVLVALPRISLTFKFDAAANTWWLV